MATQAREGARAVGAQQSAAWVGPDRLGEMLDGRVV
eukprot:CAMPEP_0204017690 /NCGR_PEP_ID=MMETSP0360-20130528/27572_1 /ASSEMBLY_ACC=CAM_ASM_000342 /TAXON_ID=268821 /ORGANISM="Scrippsiella Hangoei, Strain SHTV-5" /LENGTH=35 /DNA_ID= /DNA_START= /DNA_END= /DNA_ORIENTATION=